MANDASSGVGNSSAQTVDDHVPREWEEPASEALREGWSEAEVCAEEVAAPLEPLRGDSPREPVTPSRGNCQQERRKAPSGSSSTAQSTAPRGVTTGRETVRLHREATPQRKARRLRESNLPNQQHRDAHPANRHLRDEQPAELAPSGSGCFGKKWCQMGRC